MPFLPAFILVIAVGILIGLSIPTITINNRKDACEQKHNVYKCYMVFQPTKPQEADE